jgi:hypothetical protein
VGGRIPASANGEVDQGRRLGQHGAVGSSILVSRGGVAHRRGLSTVAAARRWSSPVLGRRNCEWRRWSGYWAPGVVEKLEDGAVVLGSNGEVVSGDGAYRRGIERGGGADGVDGARLAATRWLKTCAEDGGER